MEKLQMCDHTKGYMFWDCTHISCGTEPRRRYSIVTVSRDESANLHQQVGGGVAVQPFLNLKATWSWEILPYKYILLTGHSCMRLWQATHDLWPYTSLSFLLSHKPKKEKSSKFWCNFRHRRVQDNCGRNVILWEPQQDSFDCEIACMKIRQALQLKSAWFVLAGTF